MKYGHHPAVKSVQKVVVVYYVLFGLSAFVRLPTTAGNDLRIEPCVVPSLAIVCSRCHDC